jgi:hypothetical protein
MEIRHALQHARLTVRHASERRHGSPACHGARRPGAAARPGTSRRAVILNAGGSSGDPPKVWRPQIGGSWSWGPFLRPRFRRRLEGAARIRGQLWPKATPRAWPGRRRGRRHAGWPEAGRTCRLLRPVIVGGAAQREFVGDRGEHAQRRVAPVVVVFSIQAATAVRACALVAKRCSRRSSNSTVECQDSITALSSADPGRPIDWRMLNRSQAARTSPAVYSLSVCS